MAMISDATTGQVIGVEPTKATRKVEKATEARPRDSEVRRDTAEMLEQRRTREEEPRVDRQGAARIVGKAMMADYPPNASLEIDVLDEGGGFVYKAVDPETGEVLKQFPAEEVLKRLERLSRLKGLAVDETI
ncbi:hypothetical protein CVT23_14240 [Minwuia thermotolerans]|uniref:Flagellar protein FlaG n=2 Tax=Minwuia thermotolerans TaxID=2056226 RepID=A0A2M9G047_9PROT|nr:hypothetical protein CVT23_14240 [Minwuia thermotolerans]